MASQTERNRQNAQSSCGPRTIAGKARSSQNALKSGLYSKSAKLPAEELEEYLDHAASFVDDLQPQDITQSALVQIISDADWRLRRLRIQIESQADRVFELFESPCRDRPLTLTLAQQAGATRALESLGRHEQRLQNGMLKALKQLKDLQKSAHEQETREAKTPTKSGFVPAPAFQVAASANATAQSMPENAPTGLEQPALLDQEVAA